MPNGVSCAYFAVRNHIYGKNEQNMFKKGIAGVQTVRTADAVANSSVAATHVATPVKGFLGKAAALCRKIVYPLIIGSGIYNTVKSDDKVRTGISQASGIGTMYAFEQIAEKCLKNIDKKIPTSNKVARYTWYVAKGLTFAAASLLGYNVGSSGGEKIVDNHRNKKQAKNVEPFPVESDLNEKDIKATLFHDMIL